MSIKKPLLSVRDLVVEFNTERGVVRAIDGISFDVMHGETMGLVGESGCGKSVTSLAILGLIPSPPGRITAGSIQLNGRELVGLPESEYRKIRGSEISMIFQEPMASFAPAISIGDQMVELLLLHKKISKEKAKSISIDMLDRVGIADADKRFKQYAFELSGGMRQRAMIAMALSTMPKLLLADEPTTALDVTIQAQVIDLIKNIVAEYKMGVIFITHDLSVIAQTVDYVAVMYLGTIVESGPVREIISNPKHPYTQGLIEALPDLNNLDKPLKPIPGDIPSPLERPTGCVFHTRCKLFESGVCDNAVPPLSEYAKKHTVACFKVNTNEQ